MKRICIQIDECKPHWAIQRQYPELLKSCGLQNIKVTGDFDAKLTCIYGYVLDFQLFKNAFESSYLADQASLYLTETRGES